MIEIEQQAMERLETRLVALDGKRAGDGEGTAAQEIGELDADEIELGGGGFALQAQCDSVARVAQAVIIAVKVTDFVKGSVDVVGDAVEAQVGFVRSGRGPAGGF